MSTPQHLPDHPSLENLKKQAKSLAKSHPALSLQQAQHQLAKTYGRANWDALLADVTARNGRPTAPANEDHAKHRTEGSRQWIEPIPTLDWHKTGQSTVIASLTAALSVFGRDASPLLTPQQLTLNGSPAKTGPAWDYNTLMGDSAMAFRIRWHRRGGFRQTSPRPATWWAFTMAYAGGPEDEALLQRSTGWTFAGTPYAYPNTAKPIDQLPAIRAAVDAGRPVVASFPEEFGVITGYDAATDDVLVTAYQEPGQAVWMPITDVGTKTIFLNESHQPIARRDAVIAALRAAISNWSRGSVSAHSAGVAWEDETIQLQYGAAAYDEWADDLRNADRVPERSREQLRNASGFNMTSLSDARWAAAGYLKSAAKTLPEHASPLLAAAMQCEDLARLTSALRDEKRAFFGVWFGQPLTAWTADVRDDEADRLSRYKQLDEAAIAAIKMAVEGLASQS